MQVYAERQWRSPVGPSFLIWDVETSPTVDWKGKGNNFGPVLLQIQKTDWVKNRQQKKETEHHLEKIKKNCHSFLTLHLWN